MRKINLKPTPFLWMLPFMLCNSSTFADQLVPLPSPTWDVGIQALYLKPSYIDGFAFLESTNTALNVQRQNHLNVSWGWGFKLEGSYHFCPNNDINLNWYHYKKSNQGSFVFEDNPTSDHYTITPEWNAVNLELGHTFNFDQIINVRLHGGLQYAQIKAKYLGHGIDIESGPGTELDNMKFTGIGPRLGADLTFGVFNTGLSAYFGADAALLVGESKYNFYETFEIPLTTSGKRPTALVPELGLKIGVKYDYAMSCGSLIFDVGFMAANYWNTLDMLNDFKAFETDFGVSGWYAGVKFMFG